MQSPPPGPPPGDFVPTGAPTPEAWGSPGGPPPPPPPPNLAPPPYAYAPPIYQPQPYAVAFGGFWVRAVAYTIDRVILGVIAFVLGFVLGLAAAIGNPNAESVSTTTQSPTFTLLLYAVLLLIEIAYFAGQWTLNSATFGQRAMGLRVVDAATLQPIRPATALLRWLGLIISFLVCYVGVIWVAFDGRKQGWADKMASTVVIRG